MALSVICYGHLPNAQSRAEYERYGEGSSNHGQEVLEAKKETHIPGRNIVYLVSDPEILRNSFRGNSLIIFAIFNIADTSY